MGALEAGHFEWELEDEDGGCGYAPPLQRPGGTSGSGAEEPAVGEMEAAVRRLLQGLGEDPDREGLRKTPQRVAKAFREGTRGYRQIVKDIVQGALFPEVGLDAGKGYAGGTGGLVVVRDINLFSYCEACMLPFSILCHVGYVPSGHHVVGLSKLSRVADVFAKRLQHPQRLANEVCLALQDSINPSGVSVALQCWHIDFPEALRCSTHLKKGSRLDKPGWIRASVCSSSGVFEDDNGSYWSEFSALLKLRGITIERGNINCFSIQSWCPSSCIEVPACNGNIVNNSSNSRILSKSGATHSAMVAAAASIIRCLGEDPSRKELVDTSYNYVQWLMKFKKSFNELNSHDLNLGKVSSDKFSNGYVSSQQNELHFELNIPFYAQCEHHLLPFHGVVHICYFNEQEHKEVDRSILLSMVHFYACKLQVQERLTRQIAEAVQLFCGGGAMVVVEAEHICMISRGIEKAGSNTATIALIGQLTADTTAKASFLETILNSTSGG